MVPGYCSSKGEDLERAGQSKIGGEKKRKKEPEGGRNDPSKENQK